MPVACEAAAGVCAGIFKHAPRDVVPCCSPAPLAPRRDLLQFSSGWWLLPPMATRFRRMPWSMMPTAPPTHLLFLLSTDLQVAACRCYYRPPLPPPCPTPGMRRPQNLGHKYNSSHNIQYPSVGCCILAQPDPQSAVATSSADNSRSVAGINRDKTESSAAS
jgi:hypothetical protein